MVGSFDWIALISTKDGPALVRALSGFNARFLYLISMNEKGGRKERTCKNNSENVGTETEKSQNSFQLLFCVS